MNKFNEAYELMMNEGKTKRDVFDLAYRELTKLIKEFDKVKSAAPVVALATCRKELSYMADQLNESIHEGKTVYNEGVSDTFEAALDKLFASVGNDGVKSAQLLLPIIQSKAMGLNDAQAFFKRLKKGL